MRKVVTRSALGFAGASMLALGMNTYNDAEIRAGHAGETVWEKGGHVILGHFALAGVMLNPVGRVDDLYAANIGVGTGRIFAGMVTVGAAAARRRP